jgi:hypothetical protein
MVDGPAWGRVGSAPVGMRSVGRSS